MARTYLIDVDRETGEFISGWPRIRQSIITILTNRLRTLIMRPWWGSNFLEMQDKPGNQEVFMDGMMAAIEAINEYEPEFRIIRVTIDEFSEAGNLTVTAEGIDLVELNLRRVSVAV